MTITRMETRQRMSRIVKNNGTIYLCGQVAENASAGIQEQTHTMLAKVDALLEQAGSDREHILSATIYIRDMKDFVRHERSLGCLGTRRSRSLPVPVSRPEWLARNCW